MSAALLCSALSRVNTTARLLLGILRPGQTEKLRLSDVSSRDAKAAINPASISDCWITHANKKSKSFCNPLYLRREKDSRLTSICAVV